MPLLVRTDRTESLWKTAMDRAEAVGLDERNDGSRYWAYVATTFEKLQQREGTRLRKTGPDDSIRGFRPSLLEALAELEHQQWEHWTRAVAPDVDDATRRRWAKNWVPYADLPDDVKEQDRLWARRTLVRVENARLAKSHALPDHAEPNTTPPYPALRKSASQPNAVEEHKPKGSLDQMATKPVLDSLALGQRPDAAMPVAGRVVAVGQHGVVIKDDRGKTHQVRYEHVLDHQPPVSEQEWPEAARALQRAGIPTSVDERFQAAGVDPQQQQQLEELQAAGAPIDAKALMEEGSPEDIQAVLAKYVEDEPRPSSLPTAVERTRLAEAPGWERAFPQGKGRSSKPKNPPKRTYAADNDQARDSAFEAIKATGLVGKVQIDPEAKPEDQEHLLTTTAQTLRAIADVVAPLDIKPDLIIGSEKAPGTHGVHVGGHYNKSSKTIEVAMGLPESLVQAFGHVVDASYGGGKYGSLDPKNVVGKFVAELSQSKGVSSFLGKMNKTGKPPAEAASDTRYRYWGSPPNLFARFFESYVDKTLGGLGKNDLHHAWAKDVDVPGRPDDDEMPEHGNTFRKVLGKNDRSGSSRMKYRRSEKEQPVKKSMSRDEGLAAVRKQIVRTSVKDFTFDRDSAGLLDRDGMVHHVPGGKVPHAHVLEALGHLHESDRTGRGEDDNEEYLHRGLVRSGMVRMSRWAGDAVVEHHGMSDRQRAAVSEFQRRVRHDGHATVVEHCTRDHHVANQEQPVKKAWDKCGQFRYPSTSGANAGQCGKDAVIVLPMDHPAVAEWAMHPVPLCQRHATQLLGKGWKKDNARPHSAKPHLTVPSLAPDDRLKEE